jgi:hypothetical protein
LATPPSFNDGGVLHAADLSFLESGPQCAVYQSTPQAALATATATLITFDTGLFDLDPTMWVIGTPSHIQFNTAGKWLVVASLRWATNATGYRVANIRKNSGGSASGGTYVGSDQRTAITGGSTSNLAIAVLTGINAGDYVEVFGQQASGGALALDSAGFVGAVGVYAKWLGQ